MTVTEPASSGTLSDLSEEERRVLASAITKIEWEIYQRVLKRLRIAVAIIGSVLTVFGVATLITIRTALVDVAANRIATDADIRNQVVADSTRKLQRVNEVVASAERLQDDVDQARARALTAIRADLGQILQMTSQIQKDTVGSNRSQPANAERNDGH